MKTSNIRPVKSMIEQRVALANDVSFLEACSDDFVDVACPGCAERNPKFTYRKYGLNTNKCDCCGTHYISPRPSREILSEFYKISQNYTFWADTIFKDTSTERMQNIFRPRAKYINGFMSQNNVAGERILEVGAAYGYFADAMSEVMPNLQITCVEPTPKLAQILRQKGYLTIENGYEDIQLDNKFSMIAAFEVIEHLYSPEHFLLWASNLLVDWGLLYLTCPNIDGFETQMLGKNSDTVDHEHLNLFNPNGMHKLLKRCGFEVITISTPGKLDTDIVWNYFVSNPDDLNRSEKFVFEKMMDTEEKRERLQNLLVSMCLSSHMSIVAKKTSCTKLRPEC